MATHLYEIKSKQNIGQEVLDRVVRVDLQTIRNDDGHISTEEVQLHPERIIRLAPLALQEMSKPILAPTLEDM